MQNYILRVKAFKKRKAFLANDGAIIAPLLIKILIRGGSLSYTDYTINAMAMPSAASTAPASAIAGIISAGKLSTTIAGAFAI